MPQTNYPNDKDLERFLDATGLVSTASTAGFNFIDLVQVAIDARSDFERRCGRVMLASTGTRTFDPPTFPSRILKLGADAATIATVTVAGVQKVVNVDWFAGPENSDANSRPFKWIEFFNPVIAGRKSVVVTAQWGFGTLIPDGAWNAILCRAAWLCLPAITAAVTGGLVQWSEDDVSQNFGSNPLSYLEVNWRTTYERSADGYIDVTAWG